jgi:hypothetical protein
MHFAGRPEPHASKGPPVTSDDLVPRILAAIEEAEQIARQASGRNQLPWLADGNLVYERSRMSDNVIVKWSWPLYIAHIVHNDPVSVLRRCEADRRTVERHSTITDAVFSTSPGKPGVWLPKCFYCNGRAPCDDLRDMMDRYGITQETQA